MSHGRRRSIEDQVKGILGQKTAFGESRHAGKIDGTASDKIYSFQTLTNYQKTGIQFARWCEQQHHEHVVSRMEQYVPEYIQQMRDSGKSAYSQKAALSGLRKLYGTDKFRDVETDARHRINITRSRNETVSSRHFSEKRNAELVNFCQKTGLRRSEVENLKGDRVVFKGDQAYIQGVKGKGGRVRDVRILGNDQAVIDRIQNTPSDERVWGIVSSAANIHGYRADYAAELYREVARPVDELRDDERYIARADMAGEVFDRQALQVVAENLGHSRVSVCVQNYLYDIEDTE